MSIGARIAAARSDKGWSQAKLSKAINTAQTTVSSWERGRTEPSREDVQRVASALGVPVVQLELDGGNAGPRTRMVPIVGFVGAGAEAHYYATGSGDFGEEVEAPPGSTERTVATIIRGPSLGPLFESWLIFYDDVRTPVTPDLIGELCVVGLPDDRILVKKLRKAGAPNRFHLLSNNEDPILDQEVIWAAKVKSMTPR